MIDMAEVKYAGFWRRFVALIVDCFVLVTIQICLIAAVMAIDESLALQFTAILQAGFILVVWLYYAGMESSSYQGTLGKAVLGLAVVDTDGNRISFLRATGRNAGKLLSSAIFSIGFLLAAFTKRKQALHDLPASCLVIQERESSLLKHLLVAILFLFLTLVMTFGYFGLFLASGLTRVFQGMGDNPASIIFEPGVSTTYTEPPVMEEQLKDGAPIAAGSRRLGIQDYENILASAPPLVGINGYVTENGPMLFAVETFFPEQLWLEVYTVPIPNFGEGLAEARVDVVLVEDSNGKNYYDPAHNFESDFFRKITFSSRDNPAPHIHAVRSVNFASGLNEDNFGRIKGNLVLMLPIDVETVTFTADEAGQEKTVAGSKVTLESITNSEVRIRYAGVGKNYLRILGFNDAGQELKSSSHSLVPEDGDIDTSMFAQFNGSPASAQVIVATEIAEKTYPFEVSSR